MEEEPQSGAPPEFDDSIVQVLASKILFDWLRNRQQLLAPLTLDLQRLDPSQAQILLHAMVLAAQAHGGLDANDRERLTAALRLTNATEAQHAALDAITRSAKSLHEVLSEVADVQAGARFYAASLLAIDRRTHVNRYYIRYLAARLALPHDVARDLEQRFAAAG